MKIEVDNVEQERFNEDIRQFFYQMNDRLLDIETKLEDLKNGS